MSDIKTNKLTLLETELLEHIKNEFNYSWNSVKNIGVL